MTTNTTSSILDRITAIGIEMNEATMRIDPRGDVFARPDRTLSIDQGRLDATRRSIELARAERRMAQ